MRRRWPYLVALAIIAVIGAFVWGADHEPDRPCLKSHTETVLVPITTWAGKVPITTFVPTPRTVCDVYGEPA